MGYLKYYSRTLGVPDGTVITAPSGYIETPGTGYVVGDNLVVTGANVTSQARIRVEAVGGGGAITSFSVTYAGRGFADFTLYNATGGSGTGAQIRSPETAGQGASQAASADIISGAAYTFRIRVTGTIGSVEVHDSIHDISLGTVPAGVGPTSLFFTAAHDSIQVVVNPSDAFNGYIDNVSLKPSGESTSESIVNGSFDTDASNWTQSGDGIGSDPADATGLWVWISSGDEAAALPTYNTSLLSAIGRIEQGLSFPKFIIGGQGDPLTNDNQYALFKKNDTTAFHLFRGPVYQIGQNFRVTSIYIPFAQPISSGMIVTPILRFDNESRAVVGTTITQSTYPDATFVELKPDNFEGSGNTKGTNSFYLELQFNGSVLCTVALPITITCESELTGETFTFQIKSIFNGIAPSQNFGGDGQYLMGIGIDPDVPSSDSTTDLRTGGLIRPVNYMPFSTSAIDAAPIAIITTPKTTKVYVVLANGKLFQYDDDLTNETYLGRVQHSSADVDARGGWYYNNFLIIPNGVDVSHWGPLDGLTPGFTDDVWTGAGFGSQDPLSDATFPVTLFSLGYLNHFGITHLDGSSYFLDYDGSTGYVHKIETIKGSVQGDTNAGSAFGILDLPPDYVPITISSYGNDMVVGACYTTDPNITQGPAALFFFNPADVTPSFYRKVPLPDAICTALWYDNGVLYGLSGDLAGGYRFFRYVGGDTIETLCIIEDGVPPLQSAITAAGNRVVWGANTVVPFVTSGLYAHGSKSDLFPRGVHHIAVTSFV